MAETDHPSFSKGISGFGKGASTKSYEELASWNKAFTRDVNQLLKLGALDLKQEKQLPRGGFYSQYSVSARLTWPMEITETTFYEEINKMPQAKTRIVFASW